MQKYQRNNSLQIPPYSDCKTTYYTYHSMEPQQFGNIEPWLQESNRLPLRLFKRRTNTTHTNFASDKLTSLNKTEEAIVRKIKTQANGITFQYEKHNEAKIVSIDLAFRQQGNSSNLKRIIPTAKNLEIVSMGHQKKSIQGFSMSSAKKKPISLYDMVSGHFSHSSEPKKSKRIMSASHFLATYKAPQDHKDHSQSLNVSKIDLKTLPVADSQDFFREIANLWKQKNKILSRQPSRKKNTELEVERQLFRNRNRKFKSWQKLKKRMDQSKG